MPLLALLILAVALGTDSFSVSIGLGMMPLTRRRIACISGVVGLFHIIMPLMGLLLGQYIGRFMGQIGNIIGALILTLIGLRMLIDRQKSEGQKLALLNPTRNLGMFLLAFGVSIDALSSGLSLGIHGGYNLFLTVFAFGLVALLMTAAGLLLGKFIKYTVGSWAEHLGGIVLIGLSVYFLFT
ncbi:MAG: manganese efflux pump MntP family protein [Bacillota bacterium]